MTHDEFLHAIRAAAAVAAVNELLVFGSQAILALNPDPPLALRQSVELDVVAYRHPERWEEIDGHLGEQSQFHLTHGFYIHGVGFETTTFPERWNTRCLRVKVGQPPVTVVCPDLHDLAASKLAAGRDKDFAYVSVLIEHDLIDTHKLIRRVARLPVAPEVRERLRAWIGAVARSLSGRRAPRVDADGG